MRLEAKGLGCVRGGRQVFSAVNFVVDRGEVLLVSGRNGAGKSSLLRIIAGLLRPADGLLRLTGGDSDKTVGEQAHYLGHQDALKPSLTVAENLMFWVRYFGVAGGAESALAACGLLGIAELPASYLSAGQRRRLSLARLLAVPRPIWLLDEPAAALDREAQDRLTTIMSDHVASGGIIVAVAHGSIGLQVARALRLGEAT